jgi:predicted extracellular nuclease
MKHFVSLFALVLGFTAAAQTYYPITTLQYVSPSQLAACKDSSGFEGQIVKTVGIVVTPGNVSEVPSGSVQGGHRPFFFIVDTAAQGAAGPFRGMEVMGVYTNAQNQLVTLPNVEYLMPGDLIQFIGKVSTFNNGTQLEATSASSLTILGTRPIPTPAVVPVGALNDAQRINIPTTGEQWENAFVDFQNVTVTEVILFGGNRASFNVVDANGNKINVSDRFLAQKLPSYQTVNPASPQTTGQFVPPVPGTFYSSLKGMVRHDGNGCFTAGGTRGYELNPFAASHYQIAYAPPYISNFERDPMIPTPNQSPDLTCNITDFDGTVDSVHVFYTTNASLQPTQFTKAVMPLVAGSTDEYAFSLPNAANGTQMRYYLRAKDDDGNVSYYPTTPVGQAQPNVDYYTVRAGGMKVYDVQYTQASNGNSPYLGKTVTLKGFVTASTKPYDLGYLYIQDADGGPWSGIWCVGSGITQFFREEEVQVTGLVEEYFGMTRLNVSTISRTGQRRVLTASVLNPSDSASKWNWGWEAHEGCYVRLQDPNAAKLRITNPNLGFGDYAVSQAPGAGYWRRTLVMAGRQSATAFGSLYVQLVSDLQYDTIDGEMMVDPIQTSDTMTMDAVEGILFYGFSNFRVLPRNNDDFVGINVNLDSTALPKSTVGIAEASGSMLRSYPNPTEDVLVLDGPAGAWVLRDLQGRAVMQGRRNAGSSQIDLSALAAGTYLLTLDAEGRRQTYRVVKR